MNLLENYLSYLSETDSLSEASYELGPVRDVAKKGLKNLYRGAAMKDAEGKVLRHTTDKFGKFVVHNAKVGAGQTFGWTLLVTLGLGAAWKGLNFAFSKAYRKCGFSKGPGKQMCMARERINILQQKLVILNKMLVNCNKTSDQNSCREKGQLEIDKVKNRIESNQNKLKEIAEESINISEQKMAAAAVGMATGIAAGYAMDFALKNTWRTALAIFSQASRKCGVYKTGPTRELCMSQYKLISLNKQLEVLNQMEAKCATQKNPEDCKDKVSNRIEKTNTQIQIQKDNITVYKKDVEIEKREKEIKIDKKMEDKNI